MDTDAFVTLMATLVIGVLVSAALLHIYGHWEAAPENWPLSRNLKATLHSSHLPLLAVALALLLTALVVAASAGMIRGLLPEPVLTLPQFFAGPGLSGECDWQLQTVGFFKKVHRTRFARLDSIAYTPICLFLGAAILSIELVRA